MSFRNYCWTLNNYTQEDVNRIATIVLTTPLVAYLCYGAEIADTGMIHLQGYIELNDKRMKKSTKWPGWGYSITPHPRAGGRPGSTKVARPYIN